MIWNYETLTKFKNARFGSNIITFDDLTKERNFPYREKEYHMWLARKDKKDYLVLDEDVKQLPLKIIKEEILKDDKYVYHFVKESVKVGFMAEKHFTFRQIVDELCTLEHTNKIHQKLNWIIALGGYLQRLNVRICSNIEFGKDSTYILLGYLTNQIGIFNKPRTMAKLEYGLMFKTLMVNELLSNKEDERHNINDFLLNIGGLSPTYAKTSRVSVGTRETYDVSKFSLVLCYNTLQEISERDKEDYFDFVFGKNVIERFLPMKFTGRLNQKQFAQVDNYSAELDAHLLKMARSIEWYRQNYVRELKPYRVDTRNLGFSGRHETMFNRIVEVLSLYTESQQEFEKWVDELIRCIRDYDRMVKGSSRIEDYQNPKVEVTNGNIDEVIHPEVEEVEEI